MLDWCYATIEKIIGCNLRELTQYDIFPNGEQVHEAAYFQLQATVAFHLQNGAEPELTETALPHRGKNCLPLAINAEHPINSGDDALEKEIAEEGASGGNAEGIKVEED